MQQVEPIPIVESFDFGAVATELDVKGGGAAGSIPSRVGRQYSCRYSLYSVVFHGGGAGGGHYV